MSDKWKKLWEKKSKYISKENESPEKTYNRAGTELFSIPTPKENMSGEDVYKKIAEYCQQDVIALVQLFLKFAGKELILLL